MPTSASPKAKPGPTRAVRPPKGGLAAALDEANRWRPPHVPPGATLLVAWTNLPGENTQRTGHWALQKAWKDVLKKDFGACLEFQGHPGTFAAPGVHVAIHCSRAGDANNRLSRAKYVLDLLQALKTDVKGNRRQGLLDLIENDDVLTDENRTVEEKFVGAVDTGALDRRGRRRREAPYKVIVWVWDAGC